MTDPVDAHSDSHGTVARIYANLAHLLGGKAAAGLISVVYTVIAARMLGPADYGVLVLINYFAMFIGGLVAFSGWHAIIRYGVADAENDHQRLIHLLRFAAAAELLGGLAAVATAMILAPILGPRLGWSAEAQALAIPYSFAVLATVRATPAAFLQIIRRFDLLGLHTVSTPVMRLIGTLVVWATGWGVTGFIIAWLVAALVECLSLWGLGYVYARRHFGERAILGAVEDVRGEHAGLMRFMVTANADIMLGDLAGRAIPLIMGWVLGPAAAGLYSIAHRTTIVIVEPARILGQAAYAELARLTASGVSGVAMRHALARAVGIAVASVMPLLIIIALFPAQIATLVGGPAYADAAGIMVWLAAARVVAVVAPPTSSALIALGRPSLSVASNLVSSLLLLPLLPILAMYFGLNGAGMHALIQTTVGSTLLGLFFWRSTAET